MRRIADQEHAAAVPGRCLVDELDRITMPVMFLHGDSDPFVPYETSMAAVKQMPTNDLTVRVYPGGRHELVNELNREEVIAALATFVERVTA